MKASIVDEKGDKLKRLFSAAAPARVPAGDQASQFWKESSMSRKRKDERQAWTYRVYKFRATLLTDSPPQRWCAALRHVVGAQHDLWNACHAAWERNQAQYEALMAQGETLVPLRAAVAAALAVVQPLDTQAKARRQASRQRHYDGWEQEQAALRAARQTLHQARDTLKLAEIAYRTAIRPQLTALLDALWQEMHALGQASPLAWYNERQVTDSFRHAVERFLGRTGGPPQPKRGLTRAHLTYHFTGPPLTWEQLIAGKSSMITFGAPPEGLAVPPWALEPCRSRSATYGHLRISDDDTLTFLTWLHRRPPEGALVKGVELVGREQARGWRQHLPLWEWACVVLCEIPPADRVPPGDEAPKTQSGALDLNWRILDDDRIRVGMLYDGTAYTPLYFPAPLVARWRYIQTLQNDIAAQLERCKATLATLWQAQPLPPDLAPRVAGWAPTGQSGLLRLLRQVEDLPPALASRQPTLTVLEAWAQRTGRLWREARGLSGHLDRAKAAWYAETAKRLCTQYGALAVEALDLKRMAEQADQAPRLANSQKYRHLVGLGAFLLRLTHTAQREGVRLVKVDPAGSTSTCATCGAPVEQTGEIFLTCRQGHHRDTDQNAAKILWERAFAAPAAPAAPS